MIAGSRPLRFVMVIVGGWIGARVAILWPADGPRVLMEAVAPGALAEATARPAPASTPSNARSESVAKSSFLARKGSPSTSSGRTVEGRSIGQPSDAAIPTPSTPTRIVATAEAARDWPAAPLPPRTNTRSRLSGSAWLIVRGSGPAAPFSPQLGGSQAGARLTYALGDSRRFAIAARFSSALAMRQREAALGVDWRPTALPVHLFAEQRIAITSARGGPSLGVIAGLPATPIAAGFSLDGYGQAGAIARGGGEAFVDGAVHLTRRVAGIELGLGAWGGAQRGAARLDIGPAASVAIPAVVPLRVSVEWRQRVAGKARPTSGPALSIGADF